MSFLFTDLHHLTAQNVPVKAVYDPVTDTYTLYENAGGAPRLRRVLSRKEWTDYLIFATGGDDDSSYMRIPRVDTLGVISPWGVDMNSQWMSELLGGDVMQLYPKVNFRASAGVRHDRTDSPSAGERSRSHTGFDFSQAGMFSLKGSAGSKLAFGMEVNTGGGMTADEFFVTYTGERYEILQSLTLGHIKTEFASPYFSQEGQMYGVKGSMRVGKVWMDVFLSKMNDTAVKTFAAEEAVQSSSAVKSSDYVAGKGFFLSPFFAERYDEALAEYPQVNSPVRITRVDVWVSGGTDDLAAEVFMAADLGEPSPYHTGVNTRGEYPYPDNSANDLYDKIKNKGSNDAESSLPSGMQSDDDYLRTDNMRLLGEDEYTVHSSLGYILLKKELSQGEVMGVSYTYTCDGRKYTVGEFYDTRTDKDSPLILKMLSPTHISPSQHAWDTMMKNIYRTSYSSGIKILYDDAEKAILTEYIGTDGKHDGSYVSWMCGADRMNAQGIAAEGGDGYFDAVEGLTLYSSYGVLVFPLLHPFHDGRDGMIKNDSSMAVKYDFGELYSLSQAECRKLKDKDRYVIKADDGEKLSGTSADMTISDIKNPLTQSVSGYDATVWGIQLSYRPSSLWQTYVSVISASTAVERHAASSSTLPSAAKTQMGMGVDMSTEIPLFSRVAKVVSGEKPSVPSHLKWGLHGVYQNEQMKNGSAISGENAVYIDDFEGEGQGVDLASVRSWVAASTPQGTEYASMGETSPVELNKRRAALSWYVIDPVFYGNDSRTPSPIRADPSHVSSPSARRVWRKEIFPQEDLTPSSQRDINTFDLYYRPSHRGAYNVYYEGMDAEGKLTGNPSRNWAGIMRKIPHACVEEEGIRSIHIWLMYPYDDDTPQEDRDYGYMVFDVGEISEDIFGMGEKFDESDTYTDLLHKRDTPFGLAPVKTPPVRTFSTDEETRAMQDVGLNGMTDDMEREKYHTDRYFSPSSTVWSDPAGDNYRYCKSSLWDEENATIPMRYTRYNLTQGNTSGRTQPVESYSVQATGLPDMMDYDADGILSTREKYSSYRVSLHPDSLLAVGRNHVTTLRVSEIETPDGNKDSVRWVEIRIPLSSPCTEVGGGADFSFSPHMRMYIHGASDDIVLRMAALELEKSTWQVAGMEDNTSVPSVHVGKVSVVSNSTRTPIPYVSPREVKREKYRSGMDTYYADEGSMSIEVKDIGAGDMAMVYKDYSTDMRAYEDIRMFWHAENTAKNADVEGLRSVLLVGGDVTRDYYMITRHLTLTAWEEKNADAVWKKENEMKVPLSLLAEVKIMRDSAVRKGEHKGDYVPYKAEKDGYVITVCGHPSTGAVRVVGVGLMNESDSRQDICVWVDELRMGTGNGYRGWGMKAYLSANFSSLMNINAQAGYSSRGMQANMYSAVWWNTDVELQAGELLPDGWNIHMPIRWTAGNETKRNTYVYSDYLHEDGTDGRENMEYMSFSVDEMRILKKTGKKSRPWDVENISLSLHMSHAGRSDYHIQRKYSRSGYLMAAYNYTGEERYISPFKKSGKKWLKEISFSLMPSLLHLKWESTHDDTSYLKRFISSAEGGYNHTAYYNGAYQTRVEWNPLRSLSLSYDCTGSSVKEVPAPTNTDEEKSIMHGMFSWGRTLSYHHHLQMGWEASTWKWRGMDWLKVRMGYAADFHWQAADDVMRETDMPSPHTIRNASQTDINVECDMSSLLSRKDSKKDASVGNWSSRNILQSVKFGYSAQKSTLLPGYTDTPGVAALRAMGTLGVDFLFGRQTDVLQKAFLEGRLTSQGLTSSTEYMHEGKTEYSYDIRLNPIPHMSVTLKGRRENRRGSGQTFDVRYDPAVGNYVLDRGEERINGGFTMTIWSFASSFGRNTETHSAALEKMKEIMPFVASRMAEKYGITSMGQNGYPEGLPATHAEVMSYAFMGAYTGGGKNVPLSIFRSVPMPEISISYKGLGYLPFMKRMFKTLTLTSKYSSRYSINDFTVNGDYGIEAKEGEPYPQKYVYSSIYMTEAFSPLIGMEAEMRNGVSCSLAYKRDRMVSLNIASARVNETIGRSMDVSVRGRIFGRWTLGTEVSVRKNYVSLRSVTDDESQVSGGERYLSVRMDADCQVGKRLGVGCTLWGMWRRYMLPQMPSTFSTTGGFHVKYRIGE